MDAETTDSPTEEQLGADSPAHATGALLSGAEDPEPESTGAAPVETACENAGKELDTEQNGAPFEKPKLASSGSQEETSGDAAASDARESTEPEDMPSGGESFSREEGEEANRDNVPPDVVAEVTDAGSIPLEAILSHLPEEGSLPFLEQRLQAGEQPAEGDAGIESTEASVPSQHVDPDNTSSASDGNTPATSAAAGLEEEAPDAAPKSVEEMLEEERTKRQLAEAQVEALTLKLQEAEAATTHALEQAETEGATRRELEDMMVLIEKHFKESQAARRMAEEGLDEAQRAMQEYAHKWERLEQENQRLANAEAAATQLTAVQQGVAALEAERAELAAEKEEAEKQLTSAQAENKRLASMVNKAEEAAKNAETLARMKAEAEHHAVMLRMGAEIERLRVELESRTRTMHGEMEKWRGQAEAAATSIREAKNEVLDRKRELDMTKEKMDALVEKLYIGREIDMELRGAIDYSLQRSHNLRITDQANYRAAGAAQTASLAANGAAPTAPRGQAIPGATGSLLPSSKKAPPGTIQTSGSSTVKLPAISPKSRAHLELASQEKTHIGREHNGGTRSKKAAVEEAGEDSLSSSSGGYAKMYDSNAQHKQAVLSRTTRRKGEEGKAGASSSPKKGDKGVDRFAETKRIQMMVSHSNRWP